MCCRGATRLIVHLGKSGIRSVVEVGSQEQHNLALSYLVISKKVKWDVCIPQLRSVLIYKELGEQYCSPNSLFTICRVPLDQIARFGWHPMFFFPFPLYITSNWIGQGCTY